jgi:hypothetical protein
MIERLLITDTSQIALDLFLAGNRLHSVWRVTRNDVFSLRWLICSEAELIALYNALMMRVTVEQAGISSSNRGHVSKNQTLSFSSPPLRTVFATASRRQTKPLHADGRIAKLRSVRLLLPEVEYRGHVQISIFLST